MYPPLGDSLVRVCYHRQWKSLSLTCVENTPNTKISLGNDTEGFSDEEVVGRSWLNKDDLERLV